MKPLLVTSASTTTLAASILKSMQADTLQATGADHTVSRKFGNGWEIGGYATLTDVPFDTFGEGSFDKAIYASVPIDWIISSPNRTKRRLTLRPITRDGGAQLSVAATGK